MYTSIAIGTDGRPVISYYDETAGALKVAKCANAACTGVPTSITTVDDPANNVGANTSSIAIGNDGLPVISYHVDSADGALKVAKCANAACTDVPTITPVDDPRQQRWALHVDRHRDGRPPRHQLPTTAPPGP